MANTLRLVSLETRLRELAAHLLPLVNPTGSYTAAEFDSTRAYIVLAHAEFEAFFEDRSFDVIAEAMALWDAHGRLCKAALALVGFYRNTWPKVISTITPAQNDRKSDSWRLRQIGARLKEAADSHNRMIRQENHGIKEANLLGLLVPLGVDCDALDPTWMAEMDSFGKSRGQLAHLANTTQKPPDPVDSHKTVERLLAHAKVIDGLLESVVRP